MKKILYSLLVRSFPLLDILIFPFVYPAGLLFKFIRFFGIRQFPHCRNSLLNIGVFPIFNHYYEPQFDHRFPQKDFIIDRKLTGINWNAEGQLKMLESFKFADELVDILHNKTKEVDFYLDNKSFSSGDAEYWYQLIRYLKPKKIIEIGSGYSTLMAMKAILKNSKENSDYICSHLCIEPYEMPWLEKTGVSVIRKKVEDINVSFFSQLQENDILFIDSSHIIRPQGDVTFEYLELLPTLNKGVIVHIHDIFTPKNYLKEWLQMDVRFWNEQYLLEAFLTHNNSWQIIGALNFLHHNYFEQFKKVAPFVKPLREPGSFYIRKIV